MFSKFARYFPFSLDNFGVRTIIPISARLLLFSHNYLVFRTITAQFERSTRTPFQRSYDYPFFTIFSKSICLTIFRSALLGSKHFLDPHLMFSKFARYFPFSLDNFGVRTIIPIFARLLLFSHNYLVFRTITPVRHFIPYEPKNKKRRGFPTAAYGQLGCVKYLPSLAEWICISVLLSQSNDIFLKISIEPVVKNL